MVNPYVVQALERENNPQKKFWDQLGFKPKTSSQTLLPLSHWAHGRGVEARLHLTAQARGLRLFCVCIDDGVRVWVGPWRGSKFSV